MNNLIKEQLNYLFAALIFCSGVTSTVKGGVFGTVIGISTLILGLYLRIIDTDKSGREK